MLESNFDKIVNTFVANDILANSQAIGGWLHSSLTLYKYNKYNFCWKLYVKIFSSSAAWQGPQSFPPAMAPERNLPSRKVFLQIRFDIIAGNLKIIIKGTNGRWYGSFGSN